MNPSTVMRKKKTICRNLYHIYNSYLTFGIDHDVTNTEILYSVNYEQADNRQQAEFFRIAAQRLLEEAEKLEAK
jgi:hypothetical protein